MAESVVDSIVTFAIENLSRLLVDEVKLLWGVKDKIKNLSNELRFMDRFLKNSVGKRNDDIVKETVSQIIDVAQQAEDVIDTYVVNVRKHKSMTMFGKCLHGIDHMMLLHEVNAQIQNIKDTINAIYENKDRYNIGEGDLKNGDDTEEVEEDAESLRKRRRDVEEEEVVGLVHDSTIVIEKLKETDSRLNVVSIIGMGGLGKTTLARKIYNMDKVKDMFPCRAWGYVSNDYRARELLLSLLQCMKSSPSEYKDMSEEELKEKVKECLKGNKYLVVLDDIWNPKVWDQVKGAFPDDRNGSRILITSRVKEVALYAGPTTPYYLPFLDKKESWELFQKKVFWGKECPGELEDLGRTMVESCKGLPLAIIVLAGLVSKKDKSQTEWSRIKNHVNWHLAQDKILKDILKLSYDELPRRLKPCFLYLGIYPEDYEICVRQLIQLWIAEGFIPPKETSNAPEPEDVADNYLDKLVDRSLVQVASRRSDGGVKTFRIHDFLRDLCISESKTNKFMEVNTELDLDQCNARRLSVNYKTEFFPAKYKQSHTRSLFLFGEYFDWNESTHLEFIRKSFKLARVLDFNQVRLVSPPPNGMIHLRYLKMTIWTNKQVSHYRTMFSECIGSLWSLETLHLSWPHMQHSLEWALHRRGVTISRIHSSSWDPIGLSGVLKLKRLRHLYLDFYYAFGSSVHIPMIDLSTGSKNSQIMKNLQTLCEVALDPKIASLLNNGCFPNLKKLGLHYNYTLNCSPREQLQSLHCLKNLRTLKISGTSDLPLDLPLDANVFPSNLTKITLRKCGYVDPRTMKTLGQLTNLQTLKLKGGHFSISPDCAAGEFPQLQVLQMQSVKGERWRLEKGAMPRLRSLILKHVEWVPEELLSLTTLRLVRVQDPLKFNSPNIRQIVGLNNDCKLILTRF